MDTGNIDVNAGIPTNAMSVIGDGADDFPVLKAFQQYIDAEQNKARKRMISLCIFFGCLMTVVIIVFLILLNTVSTRNQSLNDKLIEYLVKDRDRQSSAVVVQPPADHTAVIGITAKLDEIQKKLTDAELAEAARKEANEKKIAEAKAAETASMKELEKTRIKEQLEIERLKQELAAERAKASRESEKKREAELDAYYRKQYPELYEQKATVTPPPSQRATVTPPPSQPKEANEDYAEIDALIDEMEQNEGRVNYFEEDDENGTPLSTQTQSKPAASPKPASYSIPVEVKGTKTKWRIPNN